LFVALECDRPLAQSARHSLAVVGEVEIGRGRERQYERINVAGTHGLAVRVPDRWMSSAHARLTNSFGRWVLEDRGSKNGTIVNGKPAERHTLQDGDIFELGHTLFLYRDAVTVSKEDPLDVDTAKLNDAVAGFVTLVPALARDLDKLGQLAPADVSILLLGESGTGKEVIARAIAELSGRAGEFVGVNCGAIPESLIESELFGHKKGAFSGAVGDSPGLVRSSHEGTLFLDEIADLPAPSQAAFLRVLQEREVRPVGDTRSYAVDLRLVSATHQDLVELVDGGRFRNDLFARISGYRMTLPSLRERIEDLGFLIGVLLPRVAAAKAEQVTIDVEAARRLFRYPWPLNIRELENCLRTAVVLADEGPILVEHLPEPIRTGDSAKPKRSQPASELSDEQREHRNELDALFREHKGNLSAVARALGKDRKQVQRWTKRYELDPADYR
jgi:transcriptional regulator with PAS, ATPase and Fis domain